jgi:type IV pilus assembly protein PilW
MRRKHPFAGSRSAQGGLTLIEFMISITLGMIVVAALAVLIANQSTARSDIDRTGRLIENGRYAIQNMVDDIQMAGYWGEMTSTPAVPGALPDPCSTTVADIQAAMGLHVQGYDASVFTSTTLTCVSNWKSGTDVIVVRRADPDYSAVVNSSNVTDLTKLTDGQVYLQTGLTSATGTVFSSAVFAGASASNATNFTLVKKDGSIAPPRKMLVHIYYVASCDVCTGGTADTIPTLKRVELGAAAGAVALSTVSIAEGIENLQIDYGLDSDSDGAPDGSDSSPASFTLTNWSNAMTAKIYLLARSTETTPSFTDAKTYVMGTASGVTPASGTTGYQRHMFVQSVRMANPSLRRSS